MCGGNRLRHRYTLQKMKYIAKDLGKAADASRGKADVIDTLKGIFSAIVTIAIIFIVVNITAIIIVTNLSDDVEREWFGADSEKSFLNLSSLAKPPERAQKIFDKVLTSACQQMPCRHLNYQLRYLYSPIANAFAVAGGEIVITDELYQTLSTEEGLAFVLAHEIVHHNKKHVMNNIARNILWGIWLAFLGFDSNANSLLIYFSEINHSREAEKEADLFALKIVYPLYGDSPEGYFEFFTRMNNNPNDDTPIPEWFSSHPDTKKRIDYLQVAFEELKQK